MCVHVLRYFHWVMNIKLYVDWWFIFLSEILLRTAVLLFLMLNLACKSCLRLKIRSWINSVRLHYRLNCSVSGKQNISIYMLCDLVLAVEVWYILFTWWHWWISTRFFSIMLVEYINLTRFNNHCYAKQYADFVWYNIL